MVEEFHSFVYISRAYETPGDSSPAVPIIHLIIVAHAASGPPPAALPLTLGFLLLSYIPPTIDGVLV
jgi:hypothetical protein